ncbi:hypothetical protein LSS_15971 [Leptospira santarosai serovar Shermani str. LT 821]|uniref:Uncharacterized protein n=1 Tax=Leptospira santarosai serovar Shermani str. LT 821 TaxID=758847 RepID=K8Y7J1_9LEPT|nr:hypothetical protein LSS_15971 [Leptospira santarosai serovar Shermani str. LT 821]
MNFTDVTPFSQVVSPNSNDFERESNSLSKTNRKRAVSKMKKFD